MPSNPRVPQEWALEVDYNPRARDVRSASVCMDDLSWNPEFKHVTGASVDEIMSKLTAILKEEYPDV
jgi:hypothetical protein